MRFPPKKLALAATGASLALACANTSASAANGVAAHQAGSQGCGVIFARSEGQNMNVRVQRGRVSCTQARQILRSFLSGHGTLGFGGTPHGGPSLASMYWALPGGWRCQPATGGGGGCGRGGSVRTHPRDLVIAYPVTR
jgi:hypothetical protein